MAWTTPRTWVVGETPTAAQFNAHVRDNLNFLYGAPSCRVYHNAAQSIANATETSLAFNTERFDNDTMHAAGDDTKITFTTAGRYFLAVSVEFPANATGYRQVSIRHSVGTVKVAVDLLPVSSAGATSALSADTVYAMAAAEYVDARVYQSSGGALNVNSTSAYSPEFMAHWMGN